MTLSPGPPPRRGRRDNGLDASAFVPLRDVDPRVGEHLLDVLRAAGIAAYLEPASDVDSYTRTISLPSPPSDRLWVDRSTRPEATSLVAEHTDDHPPTLRSRDGSASPDDEQAIWAQIVADYGRDSDAKVPPWPVSEDDTDRPRPDPAPGPSTPREPSAVERPGDPDDHYQPPPPPPVPALSRHTLYALLLIALGATLLVAPGLLGVGPESGFIVGVLGIVGGVGLLVYRMRERPPFDDGPDDGAVV
ncbi:hypothetical protein BH20ACT5_BH20ACT5_14380 [soil metagenome]